MTIARCFDEAELQALREALDSQQLYRGTTGNFVARFEDAMAHYLGRRYVYAVNFPGPRPMKRLWRDWGWSRGMRSSVRQPLPSLCRCPCSRRAASPSSPTWTRVHSSSATPPAGRSPAPDDGKRVRRNEDADAHRPSHGRYHSTREP